MLAENGVVFAPLLLDGLTGDRLGVVAKAICDLPRNPPSWFAELQTVGIFQLQRIAPSVKHHQLPGIASIRSEFADDPDHDPGISHPALLCREFHQRPQLPNARQPASLFNPKGERHGRSIRAAQEPLVGIR